MHPYIALHNHSCYSMLDSTCRIDDLVAAAIEEEMPALALTDRHGLFGIVEFYLKCRQAGIRPILGAEITLQGGGHLVLLCRNDEGYTNLCRLLTRTTAEYQPIRWEKLARHADGLLALSGCRHGEIPALLLKGERKAAERRAGAYAELFGPDNFYIELFHHLPADAMAARQLAALAKALRLPYVATPNTHYRYPDDHEKYLVLSSIRTLTLLREEHPEKKLTGHYHFKSVMQMNQLFLDLPESLHNSRVIAGRCHMQLLAE